MVRLRALSVAAAALLGLASCGRTTTGDILIIVDWARQAEGPGCVQVTVFDVVARSRGLNLNRTHPPFNLLGKGVAGTFTIAVAQPPEFSERVAFEATLRSGACEEKGPVLATDTWEISFELNQHKEHTLIVHEGEATDGGGLPDGGGDDGGAAGDAGVDAGQADAGDAGAGTDAGSADGGASDAGMVDAGTVDAGQRCSTDVRTLSFGIDLWTDVAVWDFNQKRVIAVGSNSSLAIIPPSGPPADWSGDTCVGNFVGVWVNPVSGLAYVLSTDAVLLATGPRQCNTVARFSGLHPTALAGLALADGGVRLIVGSSDAPFLSEVASDGGLSGFTVPGAGAVFDVSALDEQTVMASGESSNGAKSLFWKLTPPSTWVPIGEGDSNTPVRGLEVFSTNFAFAGGVNRAFVWNGSAWSATSASPGFTVRGVAVRSPTDMIAVGDPRPNGSAGLATYDGVSWTPLAIPLPRLKRVRALKCDFWAAGDTVVMTNLP